MSDVHLGYNASNSRAFRDFLNSRCRSLGRNDTLVLLGDIFDFWRRNNVEVALENESLFSILESLEATIHYIIGNHDYTLVDLKAVDKPFDVSKELKLENGGKIFSFIHGYQLEVLANLEPLTIREYEDLCVSLCLRTGDFFGDVLSIMWDMLHLSFKKGDRRKNAINSISRGSRKPKEYGPCPPIVRIKSERPFPRAWKRGDPRLWTHPSSIHTRTNSEHGMLGFRRRETEHLHRD